MFGSYLFAHFDAARDGWGEITRQPCIGRPAVLYTTDPYRPTPIPDALIERIHRCLGRPIEQVAGRLAGRDVVVDPVAVLVSIGASVRLMPGTGLQGAGRVLATRRNARLACVEIEGCSLPIWVPADRLTLLEGDQ